jgi:D-aminoacyl-tRNA deacylase
LLGLIQRVSNATEAIDGWVHGEIRIGPLLLLGVQREDTLARAQKLLSKIVNYRVSSDEREHMNLSLLNVKGSLLIVSQFTLAADTHKGLRPSFYLAAPPKLAEGRYNDFVEAARRLCQ